MIEPFQIDVVSDVVCPWCFIGKRRLGRALAMRPDIPFNVQWRAYRLDPTIPPEGTDRKAYLAAKFGDDQRVKSMGDAIRDAGAGEGIAFAYDKIKIAPNTLDAHRLVRWSMTTGLQDEIVEQLFHAYFEQGLDIGNAAVLTEIAAGAGMDGEVVARLLAGDADRELVEREDSLAHEMGISGVPTFIFANKYAVSGAVEPEQLVDVIDTVLREMAETGGA
jgi:predicted DsbA family dithiol-disulfide isomerase